jgi:hypothetical protein
MRTPLLEDERQEDASLHSMKTIIWVAVALAFFLAILFAGMGAIARFGQPSAPSTQAAPLSN